MKRPVCNRTGEGQRESKTSWCFACLGQRASAFGEKQRVHPAVTAQEPRGDIGCFQARTGVLGFVLSVIIMSGTEVRHSDVGMLLGGNDALFLGSER